jgi:TolB-like protein/Flp pilus assembly protein TadD
MSADKQDEYFSDGLAEEIINALAHIPGLNVTARTSSFSFRGKDLDIRNVAETLGVRTILEGSVRRAGNRIRVTAQLINATNGYHLWSERYDREMADVFAIQDEIAEAIASSLKVRLSADAGPARRHTPNIPAYEAFLKVRHFLRKGTPESFRRGKEWLEQAIALDANFAAAHVELASCFRLLASLGDEPTREALLQARAAAERAVKLDPTMADAHAHLAAVALFLDYDWEGAGHHFELALSHEPRSSEVSHLYGFFYLVPLGRMQAAIEEMQKSLKEDPLNLECLTQFAVLLWAVGKNDEARNYFDHVIELNEDFWLVLFLKALWLAERGAIDEGLPFARRAYAVAPKTPNSIGLLAGFLSLSGNVDVAERMIQTLGDGAAFGAPLAISVYYMVRSDYDTAADWVGKAIEQRDPNALPAACASARPRFVANGRWPGLARLLRLPESATGELE